MFLLLLIAGSPSSMCFIRKTNFSTFFPNHMVARTFCVTSYAYQMVRRTLPSPPVLNMGPLIFFIILFHDYLVSTSFPQPCGYSLLDSTLLLCFVQSCLHLQLFTTCQIYIRASETPQRCHNPEDGSCIVCQNIRKCQHLTLHIPKSRRYTAATRIDQEIV
jgi:hypothetical protein